MANPLKISIIVPSLNQGRYLEETILSILNQRVENFELIVIDGGSHDETLDVISKYKTTLTYWVSEPDSGQSEAINKGLRVATGDIVTWLNSDDYYEPGALATIRGHFEADPELRILHGRAYLFGEKIKKKVIGPGHSLSPSDYLPYMRFPQPSSFFRRSLINNLGPLCVELHYAMDFDLVARAILTRHKIMGISDILSNYRIHSGSKSNHSLSFLKEWTDILTNIFDSQLHGRFLAIEMRLLFPDVNPLKNFPDVALTFSENEIEGVFLEHLHLHYHTYYKLFDKTSATKIANYLKSNYKGFYLKNKYERYQRRLILVPKFIFMIYRLFAR